MAAARWSSTEQNLRALVRLVEGSGVRSVALDCAVVYRSDLVKRLQAELGLGRSAAYRLLDAALLDGLLVMNEDKLIYVAQGALL